MREIIKTLAKCSELRELTLNKNHLSEGNCEALVQSLKYHIHFTTLRLSHVSLSEHGFICLMLGFTKSPLQYLNISWNQLGPSVIEQLCYFVRSCKNLKKLLV